VYKIYRRTINTNKFLKILNRSVQFMYIEGDVPVVTTGNYGNNGFGFGGGWEGLIGLIAVAALFGGGYGFGGGFGFGGGRGAGNEMFGYQLGRTATSEDIASGFAQNTLQRGIDDIILGQAQMQNFINQGFSGLNTSLLSGFHGVDNAICTLGYQTQAGFNQVSNQIANCCCDLKGAIADVKYANERQTCDIINAINAGNQRLVDIYTSDKIDTLNRKLATAEAQLSNQAQSAYI
jgi:hypothetical protein